MEELELELHNLIKWECSDDNPFHGKFDLQCNIMIVNASEIKNNWSLACYRLDVDEFQR